jgi:cytochrome c-type biogenesis protein
MEQLFTTLSRAVEGAPWLALSASALWGVLSIVLSPCHLASVPLIVGFISGQGRVSAGRAFWIASLFSAGILVTIALIGILTAAAGRMLGDVGSWGNYFVAFIFFLVGLHLLGVVPMPWSGPGQAQVARKGLVAAFLLGLFFGVALGPCTFAYMAPMLAVSFQWGASHPIYAAALLLAYGIGHCSIIILAGTSTEWVQRYLNWSNQSRGITQLKAGCGILVILGGFWLLYTAP